MKTQKKYFDHIRQLIAGAEMDSAIKQLNHFLDNTPQLNEILQQSARWNALRKQVRMGTISHEDASVAQNQISSALLELLSLVEEQEGAPAIREEMERAVISIVNSKNVVTGNIHAGGNVHVGDNNATIVNQKAARFARSCVFDLLS